MAVNQRINPETTKVKTGILQSYSGTLAQVNIDGNTLNLPMLDTIGTPAVGSTVVCQVFGSTGYVIGTLNTNSRSASGFWTGGVNNPPVPNPSIPAASYSTFLPTQNGAWDSGAALWSAGAFAQNNTGPNGAAWFYGAGAFSSLTGKTLISLEVYISGLLSGAYPLNFTYHTLSVRGTTNSGGLDSNATAQRSTSGWVSLPPAFVTALSANLSAFGVGIYGGQAASLNPALPYGTLRIGWK